MSREIRQPQRYVGLELAGAKNQKTVLAAIEYYPRERKIFLLDIYERIAGKDHQTNDESLLELIDEIRPGVARLGVNVPLTLPPCTCCTRQNCPMPSKCPVASVKWMKNLTRKAAKGVSHPGRITDFTPYTLRPVELWVRHQVLPHLPETYRFEVDETLGGTKAPLTARMNFLLKHEREINFVETWPKLSMAILAVEMGIQRRTFQGYRRLEEGEQARAEILENLIQHHGVFVYDRDLRKLSHNLSAFDAFICAYTALLSDLEQCAKIPSGFPDSSGWVNYPIIR